MNKKGMGMGRMASIFFILVVVVIVVTVNTDFIKTLSKNLLGIGGDIELDITDVNEQARTGFQELADDIIKCKDIKDDKCGCVVDLNDFYKMHHLIFYKDKVDLHLVKERSDIKMETSLDFLKEKRDKLTNLNCYYGEKDVGSKEGLTFSFDDKGAYVFTGGKEGIVQEIFGENKVKDGLRVLKNFQIYKEGKTVCWLLNSYDKTKINVLRECKEKKT